MSISGYHGQYIENVHLQTYTSPEHWEILYTEQYSKILSKAEEFLDSTGGPGKDVLVFIRFSLSFFLLPVFLSHGYIIVVEWMRPSTRRPRCRGTTDGCRPRFSIDLPATRAHSVIAMLTGNSSASSRADIATAP